MGEAPSFNPTIFGQPIPQGADFSNMPDFSQIDMSQLDLSGIPQSISQMNLPQMPEGLPSMEEIQGNRRMPQMRMGEMQPRVMMAVGGSAITALSAIAKKIKNMPGSKDIRNKYFDPNVIAKNNLGRGQPSSLVASARGATINDRLRRGTELAIPAGALAAADATQGFSEEAQMQNMMLSSPEQFGKDMARMKIGLDQVIELASKKAREIGAIPGEYVGRAKQSYEQEMEAERANNLQAALDLLQKPADVGSIKPNDIQSLMSEVGIKPIGETSVFKMAMTVLSPEQKLKKIKILKKYFDKMRQAESLEKSGSALGDLSDAAKLRKGIPYNSSKSIQKELDQLQGVEKLDTDLLAILKKQYNL
jgi:hypothetical protein